MFDPEEADAVQHAWLLPFEILDLTPELDQVSPAIVTDDGAVLVPTDHVNVGESETDGACFQIGRRFAYAIAVRTATQETVLASSVWAQPPAQDILQRHPEIQGAWLVRVEEANGEYRSMILRGPEPVQPRRVAEGPTAVFLDIGMVLARFDRKLFHDHFFTFFGKPVAGAAWEKAEELRLSMESGDLLADDFFEQLMDPFGIVPPDKTAFFRIWGAILTLKRSTATLARQAMALPHVAVVVVSNTDPIRARHCEETLGLDDLMKNRVISCQDGVNPKGADSSMWERARMMAEGELGTSLQQAVAVDDIRAYLQMALKSEAATHAVQYRHFAQFRYELGACGLYLPLQT